MLLDSLALTDSNSRVRGPTLGEAGSTLCSVTGLIYVEAAVSVLVIISHTNNVRCDLLIINRKVLRIRLSRSEDC